MSGRQGIDTQGVVPDKELQVFFLPCHSEGWRPEHFSKAGSIPFIIHVPEMVQREMEITTVGVFLPSVYLT